MKDYYKVLGISRNATASHIRQAYRDLIKKYHPDVNRTATAGERTKDLNEAWAVLSDPEQKISYDVRLQQSEQKKSPLRQYASTKPRTENPPPRAEPDLCCEKCGKIDSTLRISVFWRVYSLIYFTWKKSFIKILCNKCRVKESLTASAITILIGWWSVYGLLWTPLALFKNSLGGEQPKENNAELLNALGYQLYNQRRMHDARKAFHAASKFKAEVGFDEVREYLKHQPHPIEQRSFWSRFYNLQFHPIYYHAPAVLIIFVIIPTTLFAVSVYQTSDAPITYKPRITPHVQTARPLPAGFVPAPETPTFSEPEQALPNEGLLYSTDRIGNASDTTAPLKITTRYSDGNYVMKVEDGNSGEFIAAYFIRKGSVLSIELPLGSYKLKFANGDKWYGWKYLFGPTTAYSYIPDKMIFYISNNYVHGQQIELIPQVGGNLETPSMQAANW